jgi:hypothetical protein
VEVERGGILRNVKALVFAIAAIVLVSGIVFAELPRHGDVAQSKILTGRDLVAAYARIQPGLTRASQLARYGLDTAAANTQVLSYLGVMERFMPRDSVAFDRLDLAVRDCIDARDRCMALVFRASDLTRAALARDFLSTFGLGASAAADTPRVTLLIRHGRVAFKMLSGIAAPKGARSAMTAERSQSVVVALPIPIRLTE